LVVALGLIGCSRTENPVTAEKAKEASQSAKES
jgi:hypothetical protein